MTRCLLLSSKLFVGVIPVCFRSVSLSVSRQLILQMFVETNMQPDTFSDVSDINTIFGYNNTYNCNKVASFGAFPYACTVLVSNHGSGKCNALTYTCTIARKHNTFTFTLPVIAAKRYTFAVASTDVRRIVDITDILSIICAFVSNTLAPSSVDTTLSPTRMTSAPTIESTTLSSLSPSSGKTSEPTTISPTFNNATALPTFTSTMDSTMSPTPSPSEENRTSTDAPSLILSASPTATLTTLNPANQQPTLSPTLLATSELPTEYPEMIRPPTPYPTYFREVHGWYNEPWGDVPKNAKSGKGYPVNSRSEKSTTNSLVGNGWVEEGVWLISKSSKKTIGFAYDESFQHVMSMGYGAGTTPPPKLTGKASRFINDPKVPTWNAPIMNSIDDSGVDNGIKIAAKAGKGSNLTGGDSIIVTVSKSSKTILENTQQSVDYSYMEKAAKEQTFGAPKTTKVPIPKSAKKLSDVFSDALSIEFATDFGRIKPTSKSGKNSKLQSDDVVILSSKSAKNTGSLLSKSGKSALKSTKTQYQSINYNGGKVMTKSAKSFASKSSKTSFDTTVTPEEAGLPFRAKSSKSIPILNIYSEESSNSSNFVKQVQLERHIIFNSRSMSKSIRMKVPAIVEGVVMVTLVYFSL
ncbi:hypothetical protein HJC23_006527 [Cyclotella cryptica]|uniref:Uncharacterized protein n=1 Tax=Cyclotella cryptica TaxID=29204 RepID=A0ABD3P0B2_9STRA